MSPQLPNELWDMIFKINRKRCWEERKKKLTEYLDTQLEYRKYFECTTIRPTIQAVECRVKDIRFYITIRPDIVEYSTIWMGPSNSNNTTNKSSSFLTEDSKPEPFINPELRQIESRKDGLWTHEVYIYKNILNF
jgi:hypothetical protein